ncbi:MAG TPA: hypothetical protein VK550_11170 [Polyangiaceae bacterium]|nr:hypothetical protein [Polyangiaceae bacterium]
MIDWNARVTSLNALTLTGVDAAARVEVIRRLNQAGGPYDAAGTSLGASSVDAAKAAGDAALTAATTAWATATQAAHEAADRCGRYVLGGGALITFVADGSNANALQARLAQAQATQPKSILSAELGLHIAAVERAYNTRPTASYGAPYARTRVPELGLRRGGRTPYDVHAYEVEVLQPVVARADALLAELVFV